MPHFPFLNQSLRKPLSSCKSTGEEVALLWRSAVFISGYALFSIQPSGILGGWIISGYSILNYHTFGDRPHVSSVTGGSFLKCVKPIVLFFYLFGQHCMHSYRTAAFKNALPRSLNGCRRVRCAWVYPEVISYFTSASNYVYTFFGLLLMVGVNITGGVCIQLEVFLGY